MEVEAERVVLLLLVIVGRGRRRREVDALLMGVGRMEGRAVAPVWGLWISK